VKLISALLSCGRQLRAPDQYLTANGRSRLCSGSLIHRQISTPPDQRPISGLWTHIVRHSSIRVQRLVFLSSLHSLSYRHHLRWQLTPNPLHHVASMPTPLVRGRLIVLWLVKQEVGSQLLVLIAGKVGLNSLVAVEAKST